MRAIITIYVHFLHVAFLCVASAANRTRKRAFILTDYLVRTLNVSYLPVKLQLRCLPFITNGVSVNCALVICRQLHTLSTLSALSRTPTMPGITTTATATEKR